ncbi:MAG: hypothetical protein QNK22_00565 [Xanthomonadales bacterium]|nr:hypothetical protein [Xanthomonadales bacterium]
MMWFEELTGFTEESPGQVRANLKLNGDSITSRVNGSTIVCGQLQTPSLDELRSAVPVTGVPAGHIKFREVIADAKSLHADPGNAGALFQVASQFNLLEMPSQYVTPEKGIGHYENDLSQGPACAIAAGGGTIYRSYLAKVNGQIGQSADNQIDCLQDIGNTLGNSNGRLWRMENGYAMATASGLREISSKLKAMPKHERDALRKKLRIGIQWDTQVTLYGCKHLVTQVYASALPVAYSQHASSLWAEFAQLILKASYEATLWAAILNFAKTGNNKVYLTLLGGGVFGNDEDWILAAIMRALELFAHVPLDVAIVSYKESAPPVKELITGWK